MAHFNNSAVQGDVFVRRVDAIPEWAKRQDPVNGKHVIAHSETMHHHTMLADDVELFYVDDPLVSYVRVLKETPLVHERSFDTHEPLVFSEGIYEIRRQREYTPKGYRRVMD